MPDPASPPTGEARDAREPEAVGHRCRHVAGLHDERRRSARDGVIPPRAYERSVHAAAAEVRKNDAAHQRDRIRRIDCARRTRDAPVDQRGEVMLDVVRRERRARLAAPHVPLGRERLFRRRRANLDPRHTRRRVHARHAGERRYLVGDEAGGDELRFGVRRRRRPEPPLGAADRLGAYRGDVDPADAHDPGRARPGDEDVAVASERREAGRRPQVRHRVFSQLLERRTHATLLPTTRGGTKK